MMDEPRTIYCDACGKHVTTKLVHGSYVVRTEARIAALEAQRDRLRRYVALERQFRNARPSLRRAYLYGQYQEALRMLVDAGDVTVDDARRDLGDEA